MDRPTTVVLAPAKLTTRLRLVGLREDGYHLLDAEMVSLDLADRLEFSEGDELIIHGAGPDVLADSSNLVSRALVAVGRTARVELTKYIPSGAGLGGGSADAGAVFRWAGVADVDRAARLGADVPFCVMGGRARVTGVGEVLEPLPHQPRTFTLLTPPVHCSTPDVYAAWDELEASGAVSTGPLLEEGNDLEAAALAVAPELARARDQLAEISGATPTLAGSGSTWFVEGAHDGPGCVVASTLPAAGI